MRGQHEDGPEDGGVGDDVPLSGEDPDEDGSVGGDDTLSEGDPGYERSVGSKDILFEEEAEVVDLGASGGVSEWGRFSGVGESGDSRGSAVEDDIG